MYTTQNMDSCLKNNQPPSYEDAVEHIRLSESATVHGVDSWLDYCQRWEIYHLPTREFVHLLSDKIRLLEVDNLLEVCTGFGLLSSGLHNEGHKVIAVDSGDWKDTAPPVPRLNLSRIQRMSAKGALERYNPDLVIGCWTPSDGTVDIQVMRYPSVRYYIYIAQSSKTSVGSQRVWEQGGWSVCELKHLEKYSLCRYDFFIGITEGELMKHSRSFLFCRS